MADASMTSFENNEEVLTAILDDGVCPVHPEEELNVFCYVDRSLMCLKCSLSHRGHNIETFVGIEEGRSVVSKALTKVSCHKHSEKDGLFYCPVENAPTCEVCCMTTCKNHPVVEINEHLEEIRGNIEKFRVQVTEKAISEDDISDCRSVVAQLKTELPSFEEAQLVKLEGIFKKLRSILDQREEETKSMVATEISNMKVQIDAFSDTLNGLDNCQHTLGKYLALGAPDLLRLERSGKLQIVMDMITTFQQSPDYIQTLTESVTLDKCGLDINIDSVSKVAATFRGLNLNLTIGQSQFMAYMTQSGRGINLVDLESFTSEKIDFAQGNIECAQEMVTDCRGDIWISGGHDAGGTNYSPKLQKFDLRSRTVTEKSSMPKPNGYHAFVSAPDDSLWVFGGYSYGANPATYRDVWQYHILQDKWETHSSMDKGLYYQTGACRRSGRKYCLYVFGGWDEAQYCNDIRVFNYDLPGSKHKEKVWERATCQGSYTHDYRTRAVPLDDGNQILLVSANTAQCYMFDTTKEVMERIQSNVGLSWTYSGYWGLWKDEAFMVSDLGTTVKYDAKKKAIESVSFK